MICTVLEIIEPDFGCEGIPDGSEPECEVILLTDDGKRLSISVPDKELYQKVITEGARVDYTNSIINKL